MAASRICLPTSLIRCAVGVGCAPGAWRLVGPVVPRGDEDRVFPWGGVCRIAHPWGLTLRCRQRGPGGVLGIPTAGGAPERPVDWPAAVCSGLLLETVLFCGGRWVETRPPDSLPAQAPGWGWRLPSTVILQGRDVDLSPGKGR